MAPAALSHIGMVLCLPVFVQRSESPGKGKHITLFCKLQAEAHVFVFIYIL